MKKLILVAATAASLAPAAAFADDTYTVVPMPPADTRSKFVPPSDAVFVVNQASKTITLCFPDTDKNSNYIVTCTPSTDLPD